jgi:hypothetical protein
MRWYLNQAVILYEFGSVERSFFATCQTNCFSGEVSAAYDPCGNMISLVAQATINPSYDQPINGPIEFQIPELGQWKLKELLANLTKVNTTLGEMGVSASSSGDDDCEEDECDPCDPENMFPNGERSGYDEWWFELNNMYGVGTSRNKKWKVMDCEELKNAKKEQEDIFNTAKRVGGFTGEYSDYHPGDDFLYLIDIARKVDPSKSLKPGTDKEKYMFAYEEQRYRRAIAGLQVLDCLKAKLGCEW